MNSPTCRGLGPRPILTLSSRLRRHALLKRLSLLTLAFTFFSAGAAPQKKPAEQNDRIVLEQILTQTYQPSQVGKQLMGIGGETDIRRPGPIPAIQRGGCRFLRQCPLVPCPPAKPRTDRHSPRPNSTPPLT